jgi:type VI secretion system VasD/TssJ family lipoprotein
VLLAGLFLLSGCAVKGLGKRSLSVSLTAAADCNSCGRPTGNPLQYRVLQVKDASVMTGMALTQLWDKESEKLGAALLDRREAFIDPGKTQRLQVVRKPEATAMIVVGNFCRSRGTCWYYAQPLSQGGSVKLVAGADCFSVGR